MSSEKHVYFVRHGQSDSNFDHIYRNHDSLLTEHGHAQAKIVGERIARLELDALVASPLPRALDTARAISSATNLPIEESELFIEWREPSAIYGKHRDEPGVKEVFEAQLYAKEHNFRHSDEENFAELVARAEKALAFLEAHPAKRLCVVSHYGFLMTLIGHITFGSVLSKDVFISLFERFVMNNTGISYLRHLEGSKGWQIITWNDLNHLG